MQITSMELCFLPMSGLTVLMQEGRPLAFESSQCKEKNLLKTINEK
jgi:hypothetical protein